MSNPILLIKDAGHGYTPPVFEAKYQRGDVVKVPNRRKAYAKFPPTAVVAVAVPPGFPAEYALADLLNEARPLMITKPRNYIQYILVKEGERTPYLAPERDLSPSGEPPVEIGTITREAQTP